MCDLVAPLLVTFDDEAMTHACFSKLMERMLGWVFLVLKYSIINPVKASTNKEQVK